jgi:hypothetical protein
MKGCKKMETKFLDNRNIDGFIKFTQKLVSKYYMTDLGFFSERENLIKEKILVLYDKNKILTFMDVFDSSFGVPVVSIRFIDVYKQKKIESYIIKVIRSLLPTAMIDVSNIANSHIDYEILENEGYKQINYYSSFKEDCYSEPYKYLFDFSFFVGPGQDPDFVRNFIDKKYFPEITKEDIEAMTFIDMDTDTVLKKFFGPDTYGQDVGPEWMNDGNIRSYIGFHYFSGSDVSIMSSVEKERDIRYLIAFCKGIPVGIIKHGIYGEDKYKHQALCYIDVSFKYRRLGIATKMSKKLDSYLHKDLPLVLTDESDMGKLCGMEKLFKQTISSVKVTTYRDPINGLGY